MRKPKDFYCTYCGNEFLKEQIYPKHCKKCNEISYLNPIPTILSLIPVSSPGAIGFLLEKRNINPGKGKWDFPGGFMDYGETWQQAASRETFEETGIVIEPNHFHLIDVITTPTNFLTIVAMSEYQYNIDLTKFVPNHEVSELKVGYQYEDLAFESHNNIFKARLQKLHALESLIH